MHSSHGHHSRYHHHRRREILRRLFHRCSKIAGLIVLATIGVLPLVWGGGQPWWLAGSLLVLAIALVFWLVGIWWMGEGTYRLQFSWGVLLFAVPLAVGGLQWLPLGKAVRMLSPAAARYWEGAASMPWGGRIASLSLAPDATLQSCGLFLGCLVIFLLLSSLARNRRYMTGVLCAVMLAAVGNAAQYYVQTFTMSNVERQLTGTFLNRNHFGFLMTMGIMATSALLAIVSSKSKGHHYDHRNRSLDYEHPQALVFVLTFGLFFLIVAQALSLSRGAVLTSTIGLVAFWSIWACRHHHHHQASGHFLTRHQLVVPAILLAGAFCVAMPWILEALSERYAELMTLEGLDAEGRLKVWKLSLKVLGQFGILGAGLGGYGVAVQPFDLGIFPLSRIEHAHNDFLELACELGIPVMVCLTALTVKLWFRWLHAIRRQQDTVYHWAGMGVLVAIASCLAHETVEFNLLAWPNAFCFTAFMAVATACRGVHYSGVKKSQTATSGATQTPAQGELDGDKEVFEDPEESERKLHSEARHLRHENLRRNRWRFRLAYLSVALAILFGGCPLLLCCLRSGVYATRLLFAQEALHRDGGEISLGGTLTDYTRMNALATQALRTWSSRRPKVLSTRAEMRRRMARLTARTENKVRSGTSATATTNELWLQSLEDLSEACRRVPGEGEYAFQYARAFERAMLAGLVKATWTEVLAVYEWALCRQPGIARSVREVAEVYGRAWVWAMMHNPKDAEAYRQRAIAGYLHSLDLQNSSQVLVVLQKLNVPLNEILIHVTPGKAQLDFFNSLLAVQDYDTAAQVLAGISAASLPDAKTFTAEEWNLKLREAKCCLAELTGNLQQQANCWKECREADKAWQAVRLEEYHRLLAEGEKWQADDLLKKLNSQVLPDCQVALLRARQMRSLSHPAEVVLALMPLVYSVDEPSLTTLKEALELVLAVSPAISSNSPMALRKAFLEEALTIRLYATMAGDAKSREALAASVRRLEELDATLTSSGSSHWLQEHLIAYYAALGQEALGNLDQAVTDYRLSLKRCPNFLWGVVRLAKLDPDELSVEEQKLLKWQRRLGNPIGFITKGLQWLDLEVAPQKVTALHEPVLCMFALLCTDDFNNSKEWRATFRDRRGIVFHKKLLERRMNGKLLTTKVGELLLLNVSVLPGIDTANGSHRSLQNGDLTITVGPCATRALTLQLRD